MTTVRFFMPIRASLLAAVLTEVLHGLFRLSEAAYQHQWCFLTATKDNVKSLIIRIVTKEKKSISILILFFLPHK